MKLAYFVTARKAMKLLYLTNLPGMDAVAIKLNSGLLYDEERQAARWFEAVQLAAEGKTASEIAQELQNRS